MRGTARAASPHQTHTAASRTRPPARRHRSRPESGARPQSRPPSPARRRRRQGTHQWADLRRARRRHRASGSQVVRMISVPPSGDHASAIAHRGAETDDSLLIASSRSHLPALRPYQHEAARAILESAWNGRGLTFTVVMARQAGKNELSAEVELLLLARNHRRDISGVRCAPTLEPQARISFARLWNRILRAGAVEMAAREDGRVIRFGRSRQIFLSAEPTANGMGHTAGLLLEVDEAQDVNREKFDREFRPMASQAGATTVYYGTPWDDSTLLEQAVKTNLELARRDGIR